MSTFVDYENMKLFALLGRQRRVPMPLALKVCEVALNTNDRKPESWRTYTRSYMIDIGFSAEESRLLISALRE